MPIVAMGGHADDALLDYVLGLGRSRDVLYLPTAAMEDPSSTLSWYDRLRGHWSDVVPRPLLPLAAA
jgi:hypothetical protein